MSHYNIIHIIIIIIIIIILCNYNTEISQIQYIQRNVVVHPYVNGWPCLVYPDGGGPACLSNPKQLAECWHSEICIK